MANNSIKLNNAQLRELISEAVKKAINEIDGPYPEVGSTAEKVAYDARMDGKAPNYILYPQQCNELVSHFQACMKILDKIDPTDYEYHEDDVVWFLHDIYNFLEDYAIRIKIFAQCDLSNENLFPENKQ